MLKLLTYALMVLSHGFSAQAADSSEWSGYQDKNLLVVKIQNTGCGSLCNSKIGIRILGINASDYSSPYSYNYSLITSQEITNTQGDITTIRIPFSKINEALKTAHCGGFAVDCHPAVNPGYHVRGLEYAIGFQLAVAGGARLFFTNLSKRVAFPFYDSTLTSDYYNRIQMPTSADFQYRRSQIINDSEISQEEFLSRFHSPGGVDFILGDRGTFPNQPGGDYRVTSDLGYKVNVSVEFK